MFLQVVFRLAKLTRLYRVNPYIINFFFLKKNISSMHLNTFLYSEKLETTGNLMLVNNLND